MPPPLPCSGPHVLPVPEGCSVAPATAVAVFLMLVSNQGAIPPSSSAIYISCGISGSDVTRTFSKLMCNYAIPIACIAALIALGILPVIS